MNNILSLIQHFLADEFPHPYHSIQTPKSANILDNSSNIDNHHVASPTIEPSIIPTQPDLLALYQECVACTACELYNTAQNLVFGNGNPHADLMIIGEAPGADEDSQGIPFVGRAGQLLIKTLNKFGIQREDIFVANILKHRPPNNRNPLPAEIVACTPFLQKQIALIQPKLLLTLGNFASQFILETKTGITKIRGMIQESRFGMVMPSLHPSAIIRGAYPVQLLEDDIRNALEYIGHSVPPIEQ